MKQSSCTYKDEDDYIKKTNENKIWEVVTTIQDLCLEMQQISNILENKIIRDDSSYQVFLKLVSRKDEIDKKIYDIVERGVK
jgi:hypothetical protein